MEPIHLNKIAHLYSYSEYKDLVLSLAENKTCTGEKTPERIEATIINAQRMKRIDKQCVINDDLKKDIQSLTKKHTWLLLTESWCGDGAQLIPVIAKMAELNSNISLHIILRDENLLIMDAFLTNGTRSIPKLLFIQNEEVLASWGPRPKTIQDKVIEYKKANPNASHQDFVTALHLWYAKDKTQAIQNEFKEIMRHESFF